MDPFAILDSIGRIHDLYGAIRHLSEVARSFPEETRSLVDRTSSTFRLTLEEIEEYPELRDALPPGYLLPFEELLWKVREFLQRLASKGRLRTFYGARSIKEEFLMHHAGLDRVRSDIQLGRQIALRRCSQPASVPRPSTTTPTTGPNHSFPTEPSSSKYYTSPPKSTSASPAPSPSSASPKTNVVPPRVPQAKRFAIGIDLGTTHSCVALVQRNNVQALADDHGNRLFPSCVAFDPEDGSPVVGHAAALLAQQRGNQGGCCNFIYDSKRLLGRKFNDPSIRSMRKAWPFSATSSETGSPLITLQKTESAAEQTFAPEEISSLVLGQCMKIAEAHTGTMIKDAVITVPASFSMLQREVTRIAANVAGLNVLRIVNEPVAAALAYGLEIIEEKDRRVFVFDIGGGTFDVSILVVEDGIVETKAIRGDSSLGGADFDRRLMDFFVEQVQERFHYNIQAEKALFFPLKCSCEHAKRTLSYCNSATIELILPNGQFASVPVSRPQFEQMCGDLIDRCMMQCEQVLQDARTEAKDIDDVVMVGGASRIPALQQKLSELLVGKELLTSVNPEEVVTCGAAILATILKGNASEFHHISHMLLVDRVPIGLGVAIAGGDFGIIIPRNTAIPTKKTISFTNSDENQTSVAVAIFEGESEVALDNLYLGHVVLQEIPPCQKGTMLIDVTFEMGADSSRVSVYVRENKSGRRGFWSRFQQRTCTSWTNVAISEADAETKADGTGGGPLIPPARVVRVFGISSDQSLNGAVGRIQQYLPSKSRYIVDLISIPRTVSLRPSSLLLECYVQFHELKSRQDLNGKRGTIVDWNCVRKRFGVSLDDSDDILYVQPRNIIYVSGYRDRRDPAWALLHSLTECPNELNGKAVRIGNWDSVTNEYVVDSGYGTSQFRVPRENVTPLGQHV